MDTSSDTLIIVIGVHFLLLYSIVILSGNKNLYWIEFVRMQAYFPCVWCPARRTGLYKSFVFAIILEKTIAKVSITHMEEWLWERKLLY